MIFEAIEVVERRAPRWVVAARARPVGVEVPLQRHSAHGETGGIGRAMEIAHRIEAPVLMVHEPIEGIGGTMRAREAIGARELRPFATEFEDHLPERAFWQAPRRPLTQTAQPLGELRPSAGVVDRPDPAQDECACGAITPTACGDFEDRVQETEDNTDRREEALPGTLRAFPAVGAHRLRAVGGRKRVRLLGKLSVGGLQRVGRGRIGHGRTEDAAASHRGRDIHLVSQGPGVLLVGEHVRGELLGLLDGAAHDCRPSQGQLRPIPIHRVASKHVGQGVEGHPPVTQIESLFHGLRPTHHVGHQKRRPDQEHRGGGLDLKAPEHDLLLDGPALVMQHKALVHSGGKQLRMLATDHRQMLAEALRISHTRGVVLFTLERHTDTLSSGWFHCALPIRRCLLYAQYRARGGIILLFAQTLHQPRNPLDSGKLEGVYRAMPPQSALEAHMAKFKELYPEDWQSLVYRYKEHERHPPKGKSHPMPEPTQYLLTIVKNYYRKTNKVIARFKREAQPEAVTAHSHPEAHPE